MPAGVILAGFGSGGAGISDRMVSDTDIDPGTANAIYQLRSDGAIYVNGADSGARWLAGTGGSSYEVMATLLTGSVGGSGFGSYLNLGTNRGWSLGQVGVGSASGSIFLELRPTSGAVIDTATISFSVEVFA